MIILGLDLSLSSTGWSMITDEECIIACDKICTDSKKNTEFERLYIVAKEIKELIEEHSIDVVVAEDQFFSRNPRTGLTLSKLMGAVIYVCRELDVQFELLSPTQARKILTGDGKLKKEQMANYIRENYIDLGEFIDRNCKAKNSDMYDSLVISFAWLKQHKLNSKYGNK
jgi:crossover junction endodeoxyribonuclease RuvC